MKRSDSKTYAVLTGDIVRSSRFSVEDLQSVKACLRESVKRSGFLAGSDTPLVIGKVNFYRGDGWQLLVGDWRYALRICLFLRTYLYAYQKANTRIAVGVGGLEHISRENISESTGVAFELSGALLDSLKRRRYMSVALADVSQDESFLLESVFELCDALVQGCTQRQCEYLVWALQGYKQVEIAAKLDVKQQAVGKSLNSSGWFALESVLERFEKHIL